MFLFCRRYMPLNVMYSLPLLLIYSAKHVYGAAMLGNLIFIVRCSVCKVRCQLCFPSEVPLFDCLNNASRYVSLTHCFQQIFAHYLSVCVWSDSILAKVFSKSSHPFILILRANIALNAVICIVCYNFSLIIDSWLFQNVGFYRSFLLFYVKKIVIL